MKKVLDETIKIFNGRKGEPDSFDSLDQLLQRQPYRLAFWQVGLEIINYRRFFSINDLIGIRIEDPQVFEAFKHGLFFKLVDEGKVSGLRIDHIDGLYDPLEYLQRLQHRFSLPEKALPGGPLPFILSWRKSWPPGKACPWSWPVSGTTGYDFLNLVNGVFIEPRGFRSCKRFMPDLLKGDR